MRRRYSPSSAKSMRWETTQPVTKTIKEWWDLGAKMLASDDSDDRLIGFKIQRNSSFAGKADGEPHTIDVTLGALSRIEAFAH